MYEFSHWSPPIVSLLLTPMQCSELWGLWEWERISEPSDHTMEEAIYHCHALLSRYQVVGGMELLCGSLKPAVGRCFNCESFPGIVLKVLFKSLFFSVCQQALRPHM